MYECVYTIYIYTVGYSIDISKTQISQNSRATKFFLYPFSSNVFRGFPFLKTASNHMLFYFFKFYPNHVSERSLVYLKLFRNLVLRFFRKGFEKKNDFSEKPQINFFWITLYFNSLILKNVNKFQKHWIFLQS